MGWSIGYDKEHDRDIGYGVPAVCDHPGCDARIDRGLAYVCGGEPYGGDRGCGLFFCGKHLHYGHGKQLCFRCDDQADPFPAKPDVREWIDFKLLHPSWAEWRLENLDWVRQQTKEMFMSDNVKQVVVKLTKNGLGRVLNGKEGMTFIVNRFTDAVDFHDHEKVVGQVAHVRDYRYGGDGEEFCIWSLGVGEYEPITT